HIACGRYRVLSAVAPPPAIFTLSLHDALPIFDTGLLGIAPPFFLRQVNEDWLGRYRSWLYASGFGWQVGAGVTTYIMTAAVFCTDRKSTRLNSSHSQISYAVFCLKKKT